MNNPEQANFNQKPEIMLSDCDISTRAFHALRNVGINTLSELSNCTEEDIRSKVPMTNSKTMQEIQEILSAYGLSLKS